MSVIEKVKELWNSNCDDYYITDINNNVISSFYFGEAFKSENADKILKQSEETILNWFIENKWGHCILKVQLKGENLWEKLKNIDVLNCFRIKNDENVSIKYDSTSIDTDIEKEQELKVTITDGADTYVVSINVDIQDTEFSNKPVLAYLLLVFSLCLTLTFIVFYGKCV